MFDENEKTLNLLKEKSKKIEEGGISEEMMFHSKNTYYCNYRIKKFI